MAKKSRRSHKKTSFNFLSLPFIAGILVVFGIVGAIYFSMNGSDVKGASIFKPVGTLSSDSTDTASAASKCTARVIAFSLSGVCTTSNNRESFTTATYTCSNGSTGTINRNCFNAGNAFVAANANCIKAACPTPSFSPKPTTFPRGSFAPKPGYPNNTNESNN